MTRISKFFLMILIFVFTVTSGISTQAKNPDVMVKQKTYKSRKTPYEKAEFSTAINKNGKNYRLDDVRYKVTDKKPVYKTNVEKINISTKDKPNKTVLRNGIKYRLINTVTKTKKIKKDNGRTVTGYIVFDNKEEALNSPNKQTFTANGATALCSKINMVTEKAASWRSSYIDYTFKSTSKDYYEWNGNQIDGNSSHPLKGYDKEILKSIGVDKKSYRIGNTYWKSSPKKKNGVYTRVLRVEVQKRVPHYRVNYKGRSKGDVETVITYVSTYKGKNKVKSGKYIYEITATAVYKEKVIKSKPIPLMLTMGIIVLSVVTAGVLFIIFLKPKIRRKKHVKSNSII